MCVRVCVQYLELGVASVAEHVDGACVMGGGRMFGAQQIKYQLEGGLDRVEGDSIDAVACHEVEEDK
jgi:hypothetical protein